MICAVAGTLILCLKPSELKQGRLWLAVAVFLALMIPHLTHLFSVKDFDWGGSGPKFSWSYFWGGNFKVNSLFYFMNMRFPLFFTVLFFLGLAMKSPATGTRQWREKAGIIDMVFAVLGDFLLSFTRAAIITVLMCASRCSLQPRLHCLPVTAQHA